MKKIYNFIITKPIVCLLIIIVVFFIPSAIAQEPSSLRKLIVRSFSIDKSGEEYEISVIAYIPKAAQTFSENYQLINAKGRSINDSMNNIVKLTGKSIALAESTLILVNDEVCEYGLIASLDYLIREYSLANNSIVLNTGIVPAKDVLKIAKDVSKNLGISVQNISEYDEKKILATKTNVEEIYNATFSPAKALILGKIALKDNEGLDSEQGSSSQSQGGDATVSAPSGSSSSSSEASKKKLANNGEAIVLKDGKKVLDLTYDEIMGLSWSKNKKDFGLLRLSHYSDNIFTDADVSFYIFENKAKIKTKFEQGRPIFEILINPKITLNEVNQEDINSEFYQKTFSLPKAQVEKAIIKKISSDFSTVLKKLIDNNLDLIEVYERFNVNNTKEFKNFLRQLEDQEHYMSEIEFRIAVEPIIS